MRSTRNRRWYRVPAGQIDRKSIVASGSIDFDRRQIG